MIETQPQVNLADLHQINEFKGGEHLFSTDQLSPQAINQIKQLADYYRDSSNPKTKQILLDTICVNLYWRCRKERQEYFEIAIEKLGGNLIGSNNMRADSSAKKGESISDTIKVTAGYGDILIMAHTPKNLYKAIETSDKLNRKRIPIINANIKNTDELNFDVYTIMSILTLVTQKFA